MSIYFYELPTTGAVSFADFCRDSDNRHTTHISQATQARANLRAALKESKRTDEKDYLGLVKVIDDYIPQLCAIINCAEQRGLELASEPSFSWRTTLSSSIFHNSPRLELPTLHSDLIFTAITSAFALTNLARSVILALGSYETLREITDKDRKEKDEKLNFAVSFLCQACGIFGWINEMGLSVWEDEIRRRGGLGKIERPVELSREVCSALEKMALADAQSLAIRKLLSKASFESTLNPGPPLPKSHPSPALIAKLHLECASLYSSARALAKTPSSSSHHSSKPSLSLGRLGKAKSKEDQGKEPDEVGAVSPSLRHYLASEAAFHNAMAHKWLGVDSGESSRTGEAVGFLTWSRKELDELLKDSKNMNINLTERDKDMKEHRKNRVSREIESVSAFLRGYQKINDSVSFQRVLAQSDLQSLIPAGRLAVKRRDWSKPVPAFGPGSADEVARKAEKALTLTDESGPGVGVDEAKSPHSVGRYAGSGSYF